MSGAHNLYRPRCTCCGRFCRPADEGTPFGGPQDMEPPDEEFWCAPCVEVEVAFYVPVSNANTDPDGYMTNNVEVDNRGFIYAVDRNGAGLDILELTGRAKKIVSPGHYGHYDDD